MFLLQECASVACLVETKVDVLQINMVYDLMGTNFDYLCLPATGASGGIIVGWSRDEWTVSTQTCRSFSATIQLQSADGTVPPWSLCAVYGPVDDSLKPDFLSELRDVHTTCPGALLFCGDFNLIYQAQDFGRYGCG
jgi:hypothetical protein